MALGTIPKSAGVQMDLLWTNPSPTASFAAQTVAADLSDYDLYAVRCYQSTNAQRLSGLMICPVDGEQNNYLTISAAGVGGTRLFSYSAADGTLSFAAGRYNNAQDNSHVIPLDVWGIRL